MTPAEIITPEQKAARVMFRALAQTDVLTPAQALENSTMFDLWTDRIGTTATIGEYLRHEDGLYRVQQEHTIQEHQPPSVHTAALYTRTGWVAGSVSGSPVSRLNALPCLMHSICLVILSSFSK